VVEHSSGNLKIEGSYPASGTRELWAERFEAVNTLAKSKRENYKSKKRAASVPGMEVHRKSKVCFASK
jgi:hypothetical protein